MNHPYGNDYRIQNRPPPPLPPIEDEGAPPVDIADIGHALWKVAQVCMGAFAGSLTGLFLGGILGLVIGNVFFSEWAAPQYGFLGSVLGLVVGGLVSGILIWKDHS